MRREHRGRRTRPDELDEAGELRGDCRLAVGFEVEQGGAHAGRRSLGIAALQGERDARHTDREIARGEHGQPGGVGLGGGEPRIGGGQLRLSSAAAGDGDQGGSEQEEGGACARVDSWWTAG